MKSMKRKEIRTFLLSVSLTLLVSTTCLSLCAVAAISQEKGLSGSLNKLNKGEASAFSANASPLQGAEDKIARILKSPFKMPMQPI
ncbi:MAG: hypothetical protein RR315_06550 [Oscillospiraceae bacterium]